MREMMDYNVPLGKLNRGLAVLDGAATAARQWGSCKRAVSVKRAPAASRTPCACARLTRRLSHARARPPRSAASGVRALVPGTPSTQQEFLAMTVGWCIEWLQAFFLVADDMMDHSITRRGQPCWYKVPKVGLNACNDCIVLEACIYKILKKHVKPLPCYVEARCAAPACACSSRAVAACR
jgi:geranylgeranyl pyrophosphate synthase